MHLPSRRAAGFTLIELVIAAAVISLLALAIIPVAKVANIRAREVELSRDLRMIRTAIDAYREAAEDGQLDPGFLLPEHENYPPDLETLVDGAPAPPDPDGRVRRLRFLRRIPVDPMTGRPDWLLRSYQDEPDTSSWGGQNVYDVRSRSTSLALDGTRYREW